MCGCSQQLGIEPWRAPRGGAFPRKGKHERPATAVVIQRSQATRIRLLCETSANRAGSPYPAQAVTVCPTCFLGSQAERPLVSCTCGSLVSLHAGCQKLFWRRWQHLSPLLEDGKLNLEPPTTSIRGRRYILASSYLQPLEPSRLASVADSSGAQTYWCRRAALGDAHPKITRTFQR